MLLRFSEGVRNPDPQTGSPPDFVTWEAQAAFRFASNEGSSHFESEERAGPGEADYVGNKEVPPVES